MVWFDLSITHVPFKWAASNMPWPAPIKSPVNKNAISTVKPADIIEV